MIAFALAVLVNFNSVKEQSDKIEEFGNNANVMTMTLFSVGIFIGVIQESGMVEAMRRQLLTSCLHLLPLTCTGS